MFFEVIVEEVGLVWVFICYNVGNCEDLFVVFVEWFLEKFDCGICMLLEILFEEN